MEEIKKYMETAYDMLSRIRVSGDAVDFMANARVALREAYRLAEVYASNEINAEAKEGSNG